MAPISTTEINERAVNKLSGRWDPTARALIYLLNCALKDEIPSLSDGVDFDKLYDLARFHGVSNIVCYSLAKLDKKPYNMPKWTKDCLVNAVKSENQLLWSEKTVDALTMKGINVILLKGCRLAKMYPRTDFRMMADLDILVDSNSNNSNKNRDIRGIMEEMGFVTESFEKSYHDSYVKMPYIKVELHHCFLPAYFCKYGRYGKVRADYCDHVWERAFESKTRPHEYLMSELDYYVYMLIHLTKHLSEGGSGIRSVMDIHVYNKAHGHNIDRGELNETLKMLGLYEFERTVCRLADVWFNGGEGDNDTDKLGAYIISSGTYGTADHSFDNDFARRGSGSKIRYMFRLAFPTYSIMCDSYPMIKKAPVLLPVFWLWRIMGRFNKFGWYFSHLCVFRSDS